MQIIGFSQVIKIKEREISNPKSSMHANNIKLIPIPIIKII